MTAAFILISSIVISALGVEIFRRSSLKWNWIDLPNERSSHTRPTPRGAGLVVVLICLTGYIILSLRSPQFFSWGYFCGALLVALVSWLDDLYSLPFFVRLAAHIMAASIAVINLGYWNAVGPSKDFSLHLGFAGSLVTIVWIVWVINAYNFMDGIDGIAGIQAVAAAVAWAFFSKNETSEYSVIIAGAVLGFLIHNWEPARVFMGDVGSAFLGFTFSVFPLFLSKETVVSSTFLPVLSMLFLWPFILDSVLTLLRRAANREILWKAHRSHLYQRLVVLGYSHSFVSTIYGIFAAVSCMTVFTSLRDGEVHSVLPFFVLIGISTSFIAIVWIKTATSRLPFGNFHEKR